jgi:hypothetical protein
MWQVFWLIPVVDAFPSRNYLNSGVSSSTTQITPNKNWCNWNLQLRVQLRFLTGFPFNSVHECEQDNHNFDANISRLFIQGKRLLIQIDFC